MTALRLIQTGDNDTQPDVLERYEIHMRAHSMSERTITESLRTLRRFQKTAGYPLAHMPALTISRFLASDHFGANTRNTYYGHLWRFYTWLHTEDQIPNPMARPHARAPRRQRLEPHPLTNEQLRALLASRMRPKTRAMILLGAFAGLRAHEVAKIRGEDFELPHRVWVVGKGGSRASIPLHPFLIELADSMPRKGFWFPGENGGHQHRQSVCGTVKQAMVRADVPRSMHSLRHWFCTHLVEKGVDLRTAQTLMRHGSLATTQVYVAVADRTRADAITKLGLD